MPLTHTKLSSANGQYQIVLPSRKKPVRVIDVPAPAFDGVGDAVAVEKKEKAAAVLFVAEAHKPEVDGVLLGIDPKPAPVEAKKPEPKAPVALPKEALDGVAPVAPEPVRLARAAPKAKPMPILKTGLKISPADGLRLRTKQAPAIAPKTAPKAPAAHTAPAHKSAPQKAFLAPTEGVSGPRASETLPQPSRRAASAAPAAAPDAIERMASFLLAPEARMPAAAPTPKPIAPVNSAAPAPEAPAVPEVKVAAETAPPAPVKAYFGGAVVLEKHPHKTPFGARVDLASIRAAMAEKAAKEEAERKEREEELVRKAEAEKTRKHKQETGGRFSVDGILLPATRLAALMVIVVSGFLSMPIVKATTSYFTDTEASPNHLATGTFDLEIGGFTGTSTSFTCGDYLQFDAAVKAATGSPAITYGVSVEKTGGLDALCENLELTAWLDGDEIYKDPLLNFAHDGATTENDWEFKVKLPLETEGIPSGSMCNVDIVLKSSMEGAGYSDEERIPISITKIGSCGTDEPCDPTCEVCGDVTVIVENHNTATVTNNASSSSNTGGNSANGGNGGDGGAGGNGGAGGAGGTVKTGNSSSSVTIINTVNTNTTIVKTGCGNNCCNGSPCGTGSSSASSNVTTAITGSNSSTNSSNTSSSVAGTSTTSSIKSTIDSMITKAFQSAGIKK